MKQEKIPLIDCPIDYIFGDASGKILNEYGLDVISQNMSEFFV